MEKRTSYAEVEQETEVTRGSANAQEREELEEARRASDAAWEEHLDSRLSFLPLKEAVLSDLVEEKHAPSEKQDFYQQLDQRVMERFVRCEQKTDSQRLNLSSLCLKVIPIKQSLYKKLKVLSLRDNCLDDIPTKAFTALYQLETLILSHNKLRAIPDTISALVNLRKLVASHNVLEGSLGPGLFLCSKLRDIDLSHNAITKIPEDIKAVRGLQSLVVCSNQLSTLPSGLTDLPRLSSLDLRDNPLDWHDLPEKLVLLSQQYSLARSKVQRRRLVGTAVTMRGKIQDAYRKSLIKDRGTFRTTGGTHT